MRSQAFAPARLVELSGTYPHYWPISTGVLIGACDSVASIRLRPDILVVAIAARQPPYSGQCV
ncbi:hypothetical protein AGR6A_pTi0211 [Agrobacterium sp. NCPPB 925]|nr:hypothetical protein AGR6A_pTi0211 [Agrobacterium sp. NCPPB 925]